MNTRKPIRNPWFSGRYITIYMACILLVISVSCASGSAQTPEQPTLIATELPPPTLTPASPLPTATDEPQIPSGWTTYTSQRCEYTLAHPTNMQTSYNDAYSRTIEFNLANPDEGARNFIYISVINQDDQIQILGGETVYNYDPAVADLLLNLQVGESTSVHSDPQVVQFFTYLRLPDTTISDQAAQTYENVQPWEFPEGTKEIRYYLSLNGCTYLIGGYMDTTGSDQPGAITEDLFDQIVATINLMP